MTYNMKTDHNAYMRFLNGHQKKVLHTKKFRALIHLLQLEIRIGYGAPRYTGGKRIHYNVYECTFGEVFNDGEDFPKHYHVGKKKPQHSK